MLSTLVALAPALAPSPADETVERIEAYLAPFEADGHLSGTVLVARGDDVLFERAYGMANHEHGVPNATSTVHGIASISKSMTAVIGIRMMEQQKVAPGDTIDRWLPDFPRADRITLEHLVRHRAGIPHRVTAEHEEAVPRDAAAMVELASEALADEAAFLCEPGEISNYSSAGFSVLARVLELASGESYADLLETYVCEPAGMEHTRHVDSRALLANRAQSYMPVVAGVRNAPLKDLSFLVGAGSVYSTASDLWKFATALHSGAYGLSVRASLVDAQGFSSNGATNGFRAFVDHHADSDVTIAVAANLTTGALDLLRDALPRIAAGEEVAPRERLDVTPIEVDPAELERYAGEYSPRPGNTFSARVEAGDFVVGSYVIVPLGDHRFFSYQDYAEVVFEMDEEGQPTHMTWGTSVMPRVPGS